MWDVHNETPMRANVSTQEITAEGFDLYSVRGVTRELPEFALAGQP